MSFYLGIDGGATKTACAVGDSASVLGSASAGASNLMRVSEAQARRNLRKVIREACSAAGIKPAQIESACIGVAGVSASGVKDTVRRLLGEILPARLEVVGDMVIAVEAAFGTGPGVIVNAGTGSFAFGRNERGATARAGGWGFAISDEGSGQWIGRTAVSAALRAHDRAEQTDLLTRIMAAWRAATLDEVVRLANASPPPNFAELMPSVLAAAESGDAIAAEILTKAGMELAHLADIVVQRLWPGGDPAQLAMIGSVFRSSGTVRRAFVNSLRAARPAVGVILDIVEPVTGALALARKLRPQARKAGR